MTIVSLDFSYSFIDSFHSFTISQIFLIAIIERLPTYHIFSVVVSVEDSLSPSLKNMFMNGF